MEKEDRELGWQDGHFFPLFQRPVALAIYDIRPATTDYQLAITSLVGLINRPQPEVYLITCLDDEEWLGQVSLNIPWQLEHEQGNAVLATLLAKYRERVRGLIIYDPGLLDSVNVATTLAGLRDGLIVSGEMVASLDEKFQLKVIEDLREKQWKTRLQAYQWAERNLIAECTTHIVAGLDPHIFMGLRSFLVACKTFVHWLDSRKILPERNSNGVSERALLQKIIKRYPRGGVHHGWFVHEATGVELTSRQGLIVLASDVCFNLEVWCTLTPAMPWLPRQDEHVLPEFERKIYLAFTMSDGDNIQYCMHHLWSLWHDQARGSIPIGWTFSPLLQEAAPAMLDYYLSSATHNDELISGPSGAGYIFPSLWPDDYLDDYLRRSGELAKSQGMHTQVVLDHGILESIGLGFMQSLRSSPFEKSNWHRRYAQILEPYGIEGILVGPGHRQPLWKEINGVVLYQNIGLARSVEQSIRQIEGVAARYPSRPLFINLYVLAWEMTPTQIKEVIERLGGEYEVVLPRTLLALLKKSYALEEAVPFIVDEPEPE